MGPPAAEAPPPPARKKKKPKRKKDPLAARLADFSLAAQQHIRAEVRRAKRDAVREEIRAALGASFALAAKKSERIAVPALAQEWEDSDEPRHLRLAAIARERGLEGVEVDHEAAYFAMLRAANKGDVAAQRYVAGYYMDGIGTDINPREAFRWYKRAFDAGDLKAQLRLADMYEAGWGVDRDVEEARIHRRAALLGKSLASRYTAGS